MTALTYVLYAVCWFALGAIAGAQWTRMRRDVRRIADAQIGEGPVASQEIVDEEPARKRRWPRRVLDVFVVMLFVGSAVQGFVTYERIQEVVSCQRAYQTGFADALEARTATSTEAQNASDELWTTVGKLISGVPSSETRSQFLGALDSYLNKRIEAKKKQQENPYPPSPRDLCKTPS